MRGYRPFPQHSATSLARRRHWLAANMPIIIIDDDLVVCNLDVHDYVAADMAKLARCKSNKTKNN